MNELFLTSRYENEWFCLRHPYVLISCISFHASHFLQHFHFRQVSATTTISNGEDDRQR